MNNNRQRILLITVGGLLTLFIIVIILVSNFSVNENPDYNAVNPKFATPTPQAEEIDDYVPKPTSTPEPTPTPEIPSFGGLFIAELSNKLGIMPSNITVKSYKDVTFNDTSLGCPEPGKMYAQVLTPGWKIIFETKQQTYIYHSNLDGSNYINCTSLKDIETNNIVNKFDLYGSMKINLERLKDGEYLLLNEIKDNELDIFVETLDIPIKVVSNIECKFLYKVSFVFEEDLIDLNCICEDGKNYGEIDYLDNQDNGDTFLIIKGYELPDNFMNLIGKYSSSLGFPGLPKLD
tara:strand:+ start:249 stop:1121 length:873 start_codon:yes stop_codon:yes gene_type:complete